VPLAGGSDAPFGAPDPWRAMAAAVARRSASGAVLDAGEALTPEEALALFTTPAATPGGVPRRVAVGDDADLCLLDRPWRDAREALSSASVAATWCAGRLAYER
jgi:predicted amidohydrolase YtcJ